MIAIHTVHYNFVQIHKTLRCSPAMASDLSQTLWSLEDMILIADLYMRDPESAALTRRIDNQAQRAVTIPLTDRT
jgi:hypothetical protein